MLQYVYNCISRDKYCKGGILPRQGKKWKQSCLYNCSTTNHHLSVHIENCDLLAEIVLVTVISMCGTILSVTIIADWHGQFWPVDANTCWSWNRNGVKQQPHTSSLGHVIIVNSNNFVKCNNPCSPILSLLLPLSWHHSKWEKRDQTRKLKVPPGCLTRNLLASAYFVSNGYDCMAESKKLRKEYVVTTMWPSVYNRW